MRDLLIDIGVCLAHSVILTIIIIGFSLLIGA
jgi:hypothetical protein